MLVLIGVDWQYKVENPRILDKPKPNIIVTQSRKSNIFIILLNHLNKKWFFGIVFGQLQLVSFG